MTELPFLSVRVDRSEISFPAGVLKIALYFVFPVGTTEAFVQVLPPSPETCSVTCFTAPTFAPGWVAASSGRIEIGCRATEFCRSTAGLGRTTHNGSGISLSPVPCEVKVQTVLIRVANCSSDRVCDDSSRKLPRPAATSSTISWPGKASEPISLPLR